MKSMKGMKPSWEDQHPKLHVLHDLHGERLLLERWFELRHDAAGAVRGACDPVSASAPQRAVNHEEHEGHEAFLGNQDPKLHFFMTFMVRSSC
jgi:hypothetical protein